MLVRSRFSTGTLEPFSAIVRGEPAVLSVTVTVPADAAFARGVNVTSIVQLVPGATPGVAPSAPAVVHVSLEIAKYAALAPPTAAPLTTTLSEPVLVYVIVFVTGVPAATLPKSTGVGLATADALGCTLPCTTNRSVSWQDETVEPSAFVHVPVKPGPWTRTLLKL